LKRYFNNSCPAPEVTRATCERRNNLIRTDKLLGKIAEKGYTQTDMAKAIGVTPKTFYSKMKAGVFGSDEIEIMIDKLSIEDPAAIFFARE